MEGGVPMVRTRVLLSVPALFEAESGMLKVPATVGIPVILWVAGSKVRPEGRFVALNVIGVVPSAVIS